VLNEVEPFFRDLATTRLRPGGLAAGNLSEQERDEEQHQRDFPTKCTHHEDSRGANASAPSTRSTAIVAAQIIL
jgi:hypothetical protein